MICLAFDLAKFTGWCAGDLRAQPEYGSENFGEGCDGALFTQAFVLTAKLIVRFKPDLIAIEEAIPAGAAGKAARPQKAMGYRAAVHMAAFQANVRVSEYHISSIRKHFIGNGGLGGPKAKAQTIERCWDLGWEVENDNEGDACAVWDFAGAKQDMRRTSPLGGLDLFGDKEELGNG